MQLPLSVKTDSLVVLRQLSNTVQVKKTLRLIRKLPVVKEGVHPFLYQGLWKMFLNWLFLHYYVDSRLKSFGGGSGGSFELIAYVLGDHKMISLGFQWKKMFKKWVLSVEKMIFCTGPPCLLICFTFHYKVNKLAMFRFLNHKSFVCTTGRQFWRRFETFLLNHWKNL